MGIKLHFVQLCKIWVKSDNLDFSLFHGVPPLDFWWVIHKCQCIKIQKGGLHEKVKNQGCQICLKFCTAEQNAILCLQPKFQQHLLLKIFQQAQITLLVRSWFSPFGWYCEETSILPWNSSHTRCVFGGHCDSSTIIIELKIASSTLDDSAGKGWWGLLFYQTLGEDHTDYWYVIFYRMIY